jgi:hypothetical protein
MAGNPVRKPVHAAAADSESFDPGGTDRSRMSSGAVEIARLRSLADDSRHPCQLNDLTVGPSLLPRPQSISVLLYDRADPHTGVALLGLASPVRDIEAQNLLRKRWIRAPFVFEREAYLLISCPTLEGSQRDVHSLCDVLPGHRKQELSNLAYLLLSEAVRRPRLEMLSARIAPGRVVVWLSRSGLTAQAKR